MRQSQAEKPAQGSNSMCKAFVSLLESVIPALLPHRASWRRAVEMREAGQCGIALSLAGCCDSDPNVHRPLAL